MSRAPPTRRPRRAAAPVPPSRRGSLAGLLEHAAHVGRDGLRPQVAVVAGVVAREVSQYAPKCVPPDGAMNRRRRTVQDLA